MADLTLWHNPRCSKSRAAKAILDDAGVAYVERRYLDEPPTAAELDGLCTALGTEPWDLARMGEDTARQLGLRDLDHDRARWVGLMAEHPILIERPILVTLDGRAVVGRPPEAIEALLPPAGLDLRPGVTPEGQSSRRAGPRSPEPGADAPESL